MGLLAIETDFFTQFLRIVAICLFTLLMLRIAGKRRIAPISVFDILVIIVLGSAVAYVMLYPDPVVALSSGLTVVFVVIYLQIILSKPTEHNKAFSYLLHGKGTEVIRKGDIAWHNLESDDLTEYELMEFLREKGVENVSNVKEAVIER